MICCPIWMSSLWKEIQILWSIFKGGRTVDIQQLKFCKVIMNFWVFLCQDSLSDFQFLNEPRNWFTAVRPGCVNFVLKSFIEEIIFGNI